MRIPSRLMPKLKKKPLTASSRLLVVVLVFYFLYLCWTYSLPVFGFIALVGTMGVLENIKTKNHLSKLAVQRQGESICNFARDADSHTHDTWVIRAVYEQTQSYLMPEFQSLPLKWHDSFEQDLKMDADDVEDIVLEVAERTGRNLTETAENPMHGKVNTVGDLVIFMVAQPVENTVTANKT